MNEDGLKFSKSYRLLSTPMRIFVYTHYKKMYALFGGNRVADVEQELVKPIRVHFSYPEK